MDRPESYAYWKKPWHKWMVLGATILQIVALWWKVDGFRTISRIEIRTELFSQSQWESYVTQQQFQFALSSMIIAIFLASFFIGFFVHSKKMADFTTGILLIVLGLLWCMIGFLIPIFTQQAMTILWVVLLVVALGGGTHTIWKSRKL